MQFAVGANVGVAEMRSYKYLILGYDKSGVSLVGPQIWNQAVTTSFVAAFSFVLNTNLSTTPPQLYFAIASHAMCS